MYGLGCRQSFATRAGGVNHKRVARLMKLEGLEGVSRRRKWCATKRAREVRPAADLVDRDFCVTAPDRL